MTFHVESEEKKLKIQFRVILELEEKFILEKDLRM